MFEKQIRKLSLVGVQKLSYNKMRIIKLPNELSSYENDDLFIPASCLASIGKDFPRIFR